MIAATGLNKQNVELYDTRSFSNLLEIMQFWTVWL